MGHIKSDHNFEMIYLSQILYVTKHGIWTGVSSLYSVVVQLKTRQKDYVWLNTSITFQKSSEDHQQAINAIYYYF